MRLLPENTLLGELIMPACECGAWVSRDFARVLFPDGLEVVPACLECSNRYGFIGGATQ